VGVDARHLRAFVAIAEEGTVTRAAARLHVTQPALSRTLQQLERHVGTRLIDRSTRSLRLTARGEAFLGRARTALDGLDAVLDPAQAQRCPLRLGYSWGATDELTTAVALRWTALGIETPLEFHRVDDRYAGLLDGRVDAAVVRGVRRIPGGRLQQIGSEPRVAALPPTHPLAGRDELTLADLSGERIVLNVVSGTTDLSLWPAHHRPVHTLEVGNTDEWLLAIASGSGVGVTVRSAARVYPSPRIAYRPLSGAESVPVALAWRVTDPHPLLPRLTSILLQLSARPE
jgi:DNA-binding transcriptional LysR family regulator